MTIKPHQKAVHTLSKEFVERQQIVKSALMELRPDFFVQPGQVYQRPTKEQLKGKFTGKWGVNQEWEYKVHGRGCRLIHIDTLEPIEWDSPEVNRFDPSWFIQWLEWAITCLPSQPPKRQEDLKVLQKFCSTTNTPLDKVVNNALNSMVSQGILKDDKQRTNRYTLLTTDTF